MLKAGGRISVSDIVAGAAFSPALREDLSQWAECVTGALPLTQYLAEMRAAGFREVEVVSLADARGIVPVRPGMPPLFSARIKARKAAP